MWPLVVVELHSSTRGCAEKHGCSFAHVIRHICGLTQAVFNGSGPSGVGGVVLGAGEAGGGSQLVRVCLQWTRLALRENLTVPYAIDNPGELSLSGKLSSLTAHCKKDEK